VPGQEAPACKRDGGGWCGPMDLLVGRLVGLGLAQGEVPGLIVGALYRTIALSCPKGPCFQQWAHAPIRRAMLPTMGQQSEAAGGSLCKPQL